MVLVGFLCWTASMVGIPSPAQAAGSLAYGKYKGQIVVSDAPIPAPGDDRALIAALKKIVKTTLARPEGASTWTLHFIGFLHKKPATSPIHLVFYDVTRGKRIYVSNREINVDADATIVLSSVEVSEDDGLKPGSKYEVVLALMLDDKEIVFARTKLTLK
jgi:hypothetical protein